ncbi:MAG: hypothetical protein ABL995_07580 [Bryobacteraceae bacterium]
MHQKNFGIRGTWIATAALSLLTTAQCFAQPVPARTAKDTAPIDISGYWVSQITQAWRLRMVTPPKGDYMGISMTDASKTIADAWDQTKDEAAGDQCKYYAAGMIMTLPERLHITWPDDNTLKMDIDAGTQTRVFHFGSWKAPAGPPTWQGNSVAEWDSRALKIPPARGGGNRAQISPPTRLTHLKVRTDNLKGAYLRKNGVPYSDRSVLTEYYDLIREDDGQQMMIVTTVLEDPIYLENPLILTAQFRKQQDAAGWDPTPCSARW